MLASLGFQPAGPASQSWRRGCRFPMLRGPWCGPWCQQTKTEYWRHFHCTEERSCNVVPSGLPRSLISVLICVGFDMLHAHATTGSQFLFAELGSIRFNRIGMRADLSACNDDSWDGCQRLGGVWLGANTQETKSRVCSA